MSLKKHFLQLHQIEFEDEDGPEFEIFLPQAIKLIQIEISPNQHQMQELKNLQYLIDDKQYFTAYQMKQKLASQYPDDNEYINYTKKIFETLDDDIEEIKELTQWFDLQNGWSIQQQDSRMQIRYQQLPNSPRVVARIDTEIKIPLDIFISLIYETELYPQWFPFCKDSKTVLQPDKATKILHMHSSPPIISDRELCVKGWGVNNLDYDGSVLILSHSIDKRTKLLDRYGYFQFPMEPKHVRADLTVFCTKVKPLKFDHHLVSLVICIDLKLKYIPDFLPNYMLRKFAGVMFDKLVSNSKKYPGSMWEKRKNQSQEFYGWLNEKFKEYEHKLQKN